MARILVADEEAKSVLNAILGDTHQLKNVANIVTAAEALTKEDFDLIAIDIHFDDSRMFDLLHLVKTIPRNADTPIVCIHSKGTELTSVFKESLVFSTRALGAWMLVDVHEFGHTEQEKARFHRVIERCLAGERRKVTLAAREELHRKRQEIHQLRMEIQEGRWSSRTEQTLAELRQKLTGLLVDLCDLQMNTIAQQEVVDDSREHHDVVLETVIASENKLTRSERKQTMSEIEHAVDEFDAAKREEAARKSQEQKT